MKDGKSILQKVLAHTGKTINALAKEINLKRSQNLYDIESGKTKKISPELSEKIIIAYPDINRNWLLTGEGKMLKTPENESYTEKHEPKGEWPPDIGKEKLQWDNVRLQKENSDLHKEVIRLNKIIAVLEDRLKNANPPESSIKAVS